MQMEATYKPESFEKAIYKEWEDKKYFKAEVNKNKKKFSMVMPPPNVTGQLHIGHALNNTIQDIITRYKRMQGYETLWLPGTDHAAIATEAKVSEHLKTLGLSKESIGREEFLKCGWQWYDKYGNIIVQQLKTLGVSPDWDRLSFTMDEGVSKAVVHAFVHYYNKGYIYRGKRVTNWCPSCKSAISDMENIYVEKQTKIWHIKYPIEDNSGYLVVATTRPETMFGDTAVAVNPKDKRYKHLIGKNVVLPFVNKIIPIISDEYCEIDFGSGVVKITPAHDPNDYEIGLRHSLPIVECIDENGILMENTGEFAGLDREKAREVVVGRLLEMGLLEKTEPYKHSVGECQRCHTEIEPRITTQWWVKMEELAKPAIDALNNKDLRFVPKHYEKQYLNWLVNLKDWCVSRQLWLGHRIPAYYIDDEKIVVTDNPEKDVYEKYKGHKIEQDADVLDTWFSSALWPFSTLGYPEKTPDLEYFYPNDVLVTAYDIISFWVSKMVYSGLEFTGKSPFKDVIINGIVRDKIGRKMSKSLNNGIDPLELIDKFGADSLRYSLIIGNGMGVDIKYDEEKTQQAKIFINKLYNASKYVILKTKDFKTKNIYDLIVNNKEFLTTAQGWILHEYNKLVKEIDKNLNKYELGVALGKVTSFVWNLYCDWYIEVSKNELAQDEKIKIDLAKAVLLYVLDGSLKLLHPFIPFVTEYIFQNLSTKKETIMLEKFPEFSQTLNFKNKADLFEEFMNVVKQVRNVRAEYKLADNKKIDLFVKINGQEETFKANLENLKKLVGGLSVELIGDKIIEENFVKVISLNISIYIPKNQLSNLVEEKARKDEEIKKLKFEIERSKNMLANQGFVSKAPEKLILAEKEKMQKNIALLEKLTSNN
jgi:valyl-tRNA synthetase